MKVMLFKLYALLVFLIGGLFGLWGAMLPSVIIWGPNVLITAMGSHPDHTSPAFILGTILIVPGVIFGVFSAVIILYLPVAFRFPELAVRMKDGNGPGMPRDVDLYRWYARKLTQLVQSIDANNVEKEASSIDG